MNRTYPYLVLLHNGVSIMPMNLYSTAEKHLRPRDRDLGWKKHQEAPKGRSVKYLFYPLISVVGLCYGSDPFLKYQAATKSAPLPLSALIIPAALPQSSRVETIAGGITLKTDSQGHFRGTVLVNDIPMPFLIDSGATKTSIPEKMAIAARLPLGKSIQSNTAGGKVIDRMTRIDSLKIGNAEIKELDAEINRYLDEVLIGMNTLKYFHMTQSGDTLTLVANSKTGNVELLARQPLIKKPLTVKKTVSCDDHQVCKTVYSDH